MYYLWEAEVIKNDVSTHVTPHVMRNKIIVSTRLTQQEDGQNAVPRGRLMCSVYSRRVHRNPQEVLYSGTNFGKG